jgi:hypothetical protein
MPLAGKPRHLYNTVTPLEPHMENQTTQSSLLLLKSPTGGIVPYFLQGVGRASG